MRILKTKLFHRWAKKNQLTNDILVKAVHEIEQGLVEADLGGNVYKKRVATKGKGKSGGVRTLLAYQVQTKVFFLYAFEKKQRGNISEKETKALKTLGDYLLTLTNRQINEKIENGSLFEVDQKAER